MHWRRGWQPTIKACQKTSAMAMDANEWLDLSSLICVCVCVECACTCVHVGYAYACGFLLWALLKVSASVFLIPASSHSSILTASFVVTSVYALKCISTQSAQIPAHHACDQVRVSVRVWPGLSMPNCQ